MGFGVLSILLLAFLWGRIAKIPVFWLGVWARREMLDFTWPSDWSGLNMSANLAQCVLVFLLLSLRWPYITLVPPGRPALDCFGPDGLDLLVFSHGAQRQTKQAFCWASRLHCMNIPYAERWDGLNYVQYTHR